MNTVMMPCTHCGASTFTNAAEHDVTCVECHRARAEARESQMSMKKALEQEQALADLLAKVESGEIELPPKKPRKDLTPEDVLRALAKRPELLHGVADLIRPTDLESCVSFLLATMPKEELVKVKGEKKHELFRYHHGFGTYLRNFFMMWDSPLLVKKLCEGQVEVHPDQASSAILEALWEKAQAMDL
jgi:hypothetical protein